MLQFLNVCSLWIWVFLNNLKVNDVALAFQVQFLHTVRQGLERPLRWKASEPFRSCVESFQIPSRTFLVPSLSRKAALSEFVCNIFCFIIAFYFNLGILIL